MTNKQRLAALRRAVVALKKTTKGYDPDGGEWRLALKNLKIVMGDLEPKPPSIPALGPVYPGGVSILKQDLTHPTDGLPLYPAFDDGWFAGRDVIAPEDLVITKQGSAQGGRAFYATGSSKLKYWFGHIDVPPAVGKHFVKGATLSHISSDHPRPHVHVGINIEDLKPELKGRELLHHNNYTHGGAMVGTQLEVLLR